VVDTIVRAKVVERDVLVGIDSSSSDLVEDVFDRFKLSSEDTQSSTRAFRIEISSESRYSWDENNDLETLVGLRGGQDPFDDGCSDGVADR